MSDTQAHTEKAFPFSFNSSEFATLGKKQIEAFVTAQTEMLDELQEANRHWLDRFQSRICVQALKRAHDSRRHGGVARLGDALFPDAGRGRQAFCRRYPQVHGNWCAVVRERADGSGVRKRSRPRRRPRPPHAIGSISIFYYRGVRRRGWRDRRKVLLRMLMRQRSRAARAYPDG